MVSLMIECEVLIIQMINMMRNCVTVHVSVCLLSVLCHIPILLHIPSCNFGEWYRVLPSCALLGRFAIGALILLLWQHMCLLLNVSEDASTHCITG